MVCHIKKMTTNGPRFTQQHFTESFASLKDPRRTSKGNIIYPLDEMLFLTITSVICGNNTWVAIAEYGHLKQDWFQKFYTFKKMPSHDAISDLFCVLDSQTFSECFINWVNGIATKTASDVVAIDGKTVRGAASKGNKFPLHIVTAFCAKNRLCLGQKAVAEKGNEITEIPNLLSLLTLEGSIVTVDAIGCQPLVFETFRRYTIKVYVITLYIHDSYRNIEIDTRKAH
jgi:predicted transposase YbfD/YdcC